MGRSTTLARLTVETSVVQVAIDEALLGPLDFPTAAGYRRFLSLLYGFQAPLDAALVMTPAIDHDFVRDRCKAGHIANDLMSLGLTRREFQLLARRQTIGPFQTIPEALGFMFASERLMLSIEALRMRLVDEMPVVFTLASQFLSSYKNIAEVRWRRYGMLLDRVANIHGSDAVISAGHNGVSCLRGWLEENGAIITPESIAERVSA